MNCLWILLGMGEISVRDTISYKIVRQILDHVYGDMIDLTDEDFLDIYNSYMKSGGSWQELLSGSISRFDQLKGLIKSWVEIKENPDKYGLFED